MSVKIEFIGHGDEDSDEYRAGKYLEKLFFDELPKDIDGKIIITVNQTIPGGDVKDFDVIVMGEFKDYNCPIIDDVLIHEFCFIFETKSHESRDIEMQGTILKVRYNGKYSDVTTQSEKQKYALKKYFNRCLNNAPFIENFIWLREVSGEELFFLNNGETDNILSKNISLGTLFRRSFDLRHIPRSHPRYPSFQRNNKGEGTSSHYHAFNLNSDLKLSSMKDCFDVFQKVKSGQSALTRKKLELLTKKILNDQIYANSIGKKLVIVSGRAGTGKTIKLIRIAFDLALNHNKRCLILTYNHALVGDLRRMIALAEIPDGIDHRTVKVKTLHKFFRDLAVGFKIIEKHKDFIGSYDQNLSDLYECINAGLIETRDIQDIMISHYEEVGWDYILIDEGQDWGDKEKFILYKIFGSNKLIVADGIDQLIRDQNKCNWTIGESGQVDNYKTHEKICLRQKSNLVSFVNLYAKQRGLNWELGVRQELNGGKIIIATKPYDSTLHKRIYDRCKEDGNSAFDLLFFAPPKLVKNIKGCKSFALFNQYAEQGIKLWDGTRDELREEYSFDLNEHRLLQYDSCRGLEGWAAICLDFDEFIKYKRGTFRADKQSDRLGLYSIEEERDNFVSLWSLIPLTRAIDTLVITLSDKESDISKDLRKLYEEHQDYIEWID